MMSKTVDKIKNNQGQCFNQKSTNEKYYYNAYKFYSFTSINDVTFR